MNFALLKLRMTFGFCLLVIIAVAYSASPPKYGPYRCGAPKTIPIKGLKTGGKKEAYLMYPEEASATKKFPFLVFGHGISF